MSAPFVDDVVVLGLPHVGPRSSLGPLSVVAATVNAVDALNRSDQDAYRKARGALTARPGASVDALAQVAGALARLVDSADPTGVLRQVGLLAEVSAVGLAADADAEGPR